ncbi:MAG: hypothetical protein ISR80_06400 [Nitrosopumilus sp.]|nr:hypothetical protein [Nitrosopumilus sp.]
MADDIKSPYFSTNVHLNCRICGKKIESHHGIQLGIELTYHMHDEHSSH